jgi:hypothetical protein
MVKYSGTGENLTSDKPSWEVVKIPWFWVQYCSFIGLVSILKVDKPCKWCCVACNTFGEGSCLELQKEATIDDVIFPYIDMYLIT